MKAYPAIAADDQPVPGRPVYVCPEGHRTRWDGIHDDTACRAEVRHRRHCNRQAVVQPAEAPISD